MSLSCSFILHTFKYLIARCKQIVQVCMCSKYVDNKWTFMFMEFIHQGFVTYVVMPGQAIGPQTITSPLMLSDIFPAL